ncbi:MAG: spore maturation protein [Clostridiales bacterium]|nr:spore maturation protein [Clostridiales bacterium]
MLNYLWGFMILIGILFGAIKGRMELLLNAALDASKEAVTLCIAMLGIMALWCGIMQIARASGMMEALTRRFIPLLHFLFPEIPKGHIVNEYIAANMIANLLGLGWAATPMGLKAMEELSKLNHYSKRASTAMCTFLIVNISSLELIPINIIAYRSQYGSARPAGILVAAILATGCSTFFGVLFAKIMQWRERQGT